MGYIIKEEDYKLVYDDYEDLIGNIYTDLNVFYDIRNKKYSARIETIYHFNNKQQEIDYYQSLLDTFTDYMIKNELSTCKLINIDDALKNINDEFNNLETLYIVFKNTITNYIYQFMNK